MEVLYIVLFVGVIFFGIYSFFSKRKEKEETIDSIEAGEDVLESWQYSKEDWARFEDTRLNYWIENTDHPGELFITPTSIYITNGIDEYFYDFKEHGKMVTHCSYREKASMMKFRLRWKEWDRNREAYEFELEDIIIPLPKGNPEKANKVVKYFNDIIDSNMDAVNRLLPPDKLTSLFFNDEF